MLSVNLFECDMQWKKVEVVRIPSSAYQQTEQPQRIKLSATDSTNKDARDRERKCRELVNELATVMGEVSCTEQ